MRPKLIIIPARHVHVDPVAEARHPHVHAGHRVIAADAPRHHADQLVAIAGARHPGDQRRAAGTLAHVPVRLAARTHEAPVQLKAATEARSPQPLLALGVRHDRHLHSPPDRVHAALHEFGDRTIG